VDKFELLELSIRYDSVVSDRKRLLARMDVGFTIWMLGFVMLYAIAALLATTSGAMTISVIGASWCALVGVVMIAAAIRSLRKEVRNATL
jgi:uncharacterized membrane protein (DUF485 family)